MRLGSTAAGRLRILWTVILPLSRGPIAALAIFTYLGYWNEFTWPYIIMNEADKMPLPVALIQFRSDYFSEFGLLMAGATISAAPAVDRSSLSRSGRSSAR